ncbi:MAG: hypothetical protein J7K77_01145 [Dehalococcoidales bacterium]|nr:hypothetical protein [Dehalococcoidales bacterium]
MKRRKMFIILATSLEEIVLAMFILWGLPTLGVHLPRGVFIGIMVGLAVYGISSYRAGSRALNQKPVIGLTMVGNRGRVVKALAPEGIIRIDDELWQARTVGQGIDIGREVVVVKRDGLSLTVCDSSDGKLPVKPE